MLKKFYYFQVYLFLLVYLLQIYQRRLSKKVIILFFAGNECIQFYKSKGDTEDALNIIVHGTWKEGTNTLLDMLHLLRIYHFQTDITTVAVALPGYSDSSTNNFKSLAHEGMETYL